MARVVNCPSCGKPVEWIPDNAWRPFCRERCKLIDLGAWATERYRFPVTEQDADLEPSAADPSPAENREP
jgi:endogenous inhibitor of DNA gyrase (YacG/DUF329 family)